MANSNFRFTLPLSLNIEINSESASIQNVGREAMLPAASEAPASEAEILQQAKQTIGKRPDVIDVRLGYKFVNGVITKNRAIVVVVQERKSVAALTKNNISPIPNRFMGYPVDITTPSISQLISTNREIIKKTGLIVEPEARYFPPDGVTLKKISNKEMRVVACVSPENGWKQLKPFIEGTKQTMTLAMFDLGAPHIIESLENLGDKQGFRNFIMTLQPGQSLKKDRENDENDTKRFDKTDQEAVDILEEKLGDRFEISWIHIGSVNGWVNSSYHIKVAVRDKKIVHLSSGNYQSSNQPDDEIVDGNTIPFLLRTYNREWHIIIEDDEIADVYEKFIEHDFKNNRPDAREALIARQDLFVMVPINIEVEAESEAMRKTSFAPFDPGARQFTVTPLLSPDNYFEEVLALVKKAKRQLYIQNQTFNFPKDGQDKLDELVSAVLEKQEIGVDVKVIFRTMFSATTRENIEGLVDKGFQPGTFRFHEKVHTKGIIVDDDFVCIGSQNWSNDGVSVNRDASLLFEDRDLTKYFKEIFLHDWNFVAKNNIGRESAPASIVSGEAVVPEGMQVIPLKDILETM
ncbi:MAG: phospholipase D-like domain-containing protein [Ferruginibacter sp.]